MELNPVTRKETFLAAAAGQDVTTPTPITREEVFLDAIAKSGGGGGSSGGGVLVVHNVDGALDKTWQEIVNAMAAGGAALVYGSNENIMGIQVIPNAYYDEEEEHPYIVQIGMLTFTSTTANGYPAAE